jgi:hypothetical protein
MFILPRKERTYSACFSRLLLVGFRQCLHLDATRKRAPCAVMMKPRKVHRQGRSTAPLPPLTASFNRAARKRSEVISRSPARFDAKYMLQSSARQQKT